MGISADVRRPGPDWFTDGYAQASFERYLTGFAGQPGLLFLQVGAYCGDASVWLADHVLTGEGSALVDVDTWVGSDESVHRLIDFGEVMRFYADRVDPRTVHAWRGTSDDFFALNRGRLFDFIYIDGSHQAHQVLRDAVNADWALKPGGLLAFDDYLWSDGHDDRPKQAIDSFMTCFAAQYDVLEAGLQVWMRKR